MKTKKATTYFFDIRKRIDRKIKLDKIKKIRSFYFNCINSKDPKFIKKQIELFFRGANYYSMTVRDGFSCTVIIHSSEGDFYANAFFNFNAFHEIVKDIYFYNIKNLN